MTDEGIVIAAREMSMQTRYHLNALFLLVLLGAATAAEAQVQPELAKRYFEEATKLCERDAGRLWGVSLCGPMVIFDQATGTRATSQPEPEGPPPRFPGFADGPVSWGGLRWFSCALVHAPGERCRCTPANDASRAVPSHSARAGVHARRATASTSISIRSKGASGCSSNGGRSAGRWSRAGATGPRRSPMRWPSGANAAACFPARRTTNGATRFAKGLPPIRHRTARKGGDGAVAVEPLARAHHLGILRRLDRRVAIDRGRLLQPFGLGGSHGCLGRRCEARAARRDFLVGASSADAWPAGSAASSIAAQAERRSGAVIRHESRSLPDAARDLAWNDEPPPRKARGKNWQPARRIPPERVGPGCCRHKKGACPGGGAH